MTYCLAIAAANGLVFASDSRTNAGVDMASTYGKMASFGVPGQCQFTILTSGNLATSQAVIRRIKKEIKTEETNLLTFNYMPDVAEYIGEISKEEQEKSADEKINVESFFVVGGQIKGRNASIYLIYPQGNYITTSDDTTFLQIGESKYGKPILDRILQSDVSVETAATCALVSMDSTMRSNLTVGPPVELTVYETDSLEAGRYYKFEENSEYLRQLNTGWDQLIIEAFKKLPPVAWSGNWDKQDADDSKDAAR